MVSQNIIETNSFFFESIKQTVDTLRCFFKPYTKFLLPLI